MAHVLVFWPPLATREQTIPLAVDKFYEITVLKTIKKKKIMEITGKVVKILDTLSGVSARNGEPWVKNTFVIETQGQYPKKIAFTVMGEQRFAEMAIAVGGTYNVSFDVESREWQGKWFTDVSAWRALRVDGQQAAQQTVAVQSPVPNAQPAPTHTQDGGQQEKADDLPF